MIRQAICTICAISFFLSWPLVKADQYKKPLPFVATFSSGIADGDATNIDIVNLRQLDDTGDYPEFSPDGSKILFEKPELGKVSSSRRRPTEVVLVAVREEKSIWIMNRDGSNKIKLIDKACRGTWSPDGSRIAYFACSSSRLYIYDIPSKKKFDLSIRCCGTRVNWSKDAKTLFLWDGFYYIRPVPQEKRPLYVIDLDNLEQKTIGDITLPWIEQNGSIVVHPKTLFSAEQTGIWGANKDDSFRRLMVPGDWHSASLSPNLSEIVLGKLRGVWLANLRIIENPPNRVFMVDLGENQLARLLGYCRGYIDVFGEVKGAQRNPLNQKIIGPDDKLKGKVKFIRINEDHSEVRVVEEISPIKSGDILHRPSVGQRGCTTGNEYRIWSVLRK